MVTLKGEQTVTCMRALVIENNASRILEIRNNLKASNIKPSVAHSAEHALQSIKTYSTDAIVIGASFNDLECRALIRDLREAMRGKGMRTPIIALVHKPQQNTIADILQSGANDCFIVPEQTAEVGLRVKMNVARFWGHINHIIKVDDRLSLNLFDAVVSHDGEHLNIPDQLFDIFEYLALRMNSGSTPYKKLLDYIIGEEDKETTIGSLKVQIFTLRALLGKLANSQVNYIASTSKYGLRLVDPAKEKETKLSVKDVFDGMAQNKKSAKKVLLVGDAQPATMAFYKSADDITINVLKPKNALETLKTESFHAILVTDGANDRNDALIRALKDAAPETPVLGICETAQNSLPFIRNGADGTLVKPYSLKELSARIDTALNRSSDQLPRPIKIDAHLRIDQQMKRVFFDDVPIKLSAGGYQILERLALTYERNKESSVPRTVLAHDICTDGSLSTLIKTLRQKLPATADGGSYIDVFDGGVKFRVSGDVFHASPLIRSSVHFSSKSGKPDKHPSKPGNPNIALNSSFRV